MRKKVFQVVITNGEQLLLVLRSVYNDGRDQYLRTVISCGPIVLRRNDKTIV